MGKPWEKWEYHGKTMEKMGKSGKPWEIHRKTCHKNGEIVGNHGD